MKHFCTLALCGALALLTGCGTKTIKPETPCSGLFARAKEQYDREKYEKASESFQQILFRCTGSDQTVNIIYYLGMSEFNLKKYDQAEYRFRDIVRDYHSDSLAESAQFMVGRCLFALSRPPDRDQTETRDAIKEFQQLAEEFPQSPYADSARAYIQQCRDKMALKELINGTLYKKLQEYRAAIIYYRDMLKEYPDSRWVIPARFELAYALSMDNKPEEARDICENLLKEPLSGDVKAKTENLLKRLKK